MKVFHSVVFLSEKFWIWVELSFQWNDFIFDQFIGFPIRLLKRVLNLFFIIWIIGIAVNCNLQIACKRTALISPLNGRNQNRRLMSTECCLNRWNFNNSSSISNRFQALSNGSFKHFHRMKTFIEKFRKITRLLPKQTAIELFNRNQNCATGSTGFHVPYSAAESANLTSLTRLSLEVIITQGLDEIV